MEFPEANDPDIAAFKEGEELAKEFIKQKFEELRDTPNPTPIPTPTPRPPTIPELPESLSTPANNDNSINVEVSIENINADGLDLDEAREMVGQEIGKQFRRASGVI